MYVNLQYITTNQLFCFTVVHFSDMIINGFSGLCSRYFTFGYNHPDGVFQNADFAAVSIRNDYSISLNHYVFLATDINLLRAQ